MLCALRLLPLPTARWLARRAPLRRARRRCNTGLACFHAGQYDMALPCMERALGLAGDGAAPDVWYNLGQARGRGLARGARKHA